MDKISTYYTLQNLADELGVHPLTIQLYIAAGIVNAEYFGDLLRIKITPFEMKALRAYVALERTQRKIGRLAKQMIQREVIT